MVEPSGTLPMRRSVRVSRSGGIAVSMAEAPRGRSQIETNPDGFEISCAINFPPTVVDVKVTAASKTLGALARVMGSALPRPAIRMKKFDQVAQV
jgi:hypothetical protein